MVVLVNKKKFIMFLAVLIAFILILVGILNINNYRELVYPQKYSIYVDKYSALYNVDKFLIYSVIKAESNFNEKSVSKKGAIGLMQIMPETGDDLANKIGINNFSSKDLFLAEHNINIGCYYISFLLDRYNGDIKTALAAYNAGFGNVDNWLAFSQKNIIEYENIPYGETKKYIEKVLNYVDGYKKLYEEEK